MHVMTMTELATSLRAQAKQLLYVARLRPFDTSTESGRSKERYRRIALTMTSGLLMRTMVTVVNLVTIPLILTYLGKTQFGLWSAITSVTIWLSLFDFGIANGLVNAISEAHGKDDREAAAHYVSTAAIILSLIAVLGAALFVIVAPLISWDAVFAARGIVSAQVLRWSVIAAVGTFLLGMPLSIVQQVYASYQKSYVANLFSGVGAVATVLVVWIAVTLRVGLPMLIMAFSLAGLMVTLGNLVFLTRSDMRWLRIRWSLFSLRALRRLLMTSVPLFLLQIGALVVNQSQLIVVAHVANLNTVAEYALIVRIIQIFSGLVLVTSAFVPPYREAFERGDHGWVVGGFKRMLLLRMVFAALFAVGLIAAGNGFVRLWLHRADLTFGLEVWMALSLYVLAGTWVAAHGDLLTILDRIWIQAALAMVNGVATIGLTLWWAPAYGILGVVAAGGVTTVFAWTWLLPIIVRTTLPRWGAVKVLVGGP